MTFIDIFARNFVHNYMLKNVNLLKKTLHKFGRTKYLSFYIEACFYSHLIDNTHSTVTVAAAANDLCAGGRGDNGLGVEAALAATRPNGDLSAACKSEPIRTKTKLISVFAKVLKIPFFLQFSFQFNRKCPGFFLYSTFKKQSR